MATAFVFLVRFIGIGKIPLNVPLENVTYFCGRFTHYYDMFLSPFQDTPVMSERSLKLSPYLFQIVALYFEPFWKPEYVVGINFWRIIKLND